MSTYTGVDELRLEMSVSDIITAVLTMIGHRNESVRTSALVSTKRLAKYGMFLVYQYIHVFTARQAIFVSGCCRPILSHLFCVVSEIKVGSFGGRPSIV